MPTLFVLETDGSAIVGFVGDPQALALGAGYVRVVDPARLAFGPTQTADGVRITVNIRPVSHVDWVAVMYVKPTAYYDAGEALSRIHEDAIRSFRAEHDKVRAARSGLHLASEVSAADVQAASTLSGVKKVH